MASFSQDRKQQIRSALLPQKAARRREIDLYKSSSMIEQINLGRIMEEAEWRLSSTHSSTFRQTHQLSFIKDKFRRMIELQNISFVERNQLQKEREEILKEQEMKVRTRANKVKDERSRNGEATRSWRVRNMQEAAIAREKRLHNQWIRAKRDTDDLMDKRSMVSDRHRSMLVTHGKALEARTDQSVRKELKAHQEYRCGLIREMRHLVSPRDSKGQQGESQRDDEACEEERYKLRQIQGPRRC